MQHKCSHCGNARCKLGAPSVHVLDVAGWEIHKQQFLCEGIAQELGILPQKSASLPISSALLENIVGELKAAQATTPPAVGGPRGKVSEATCAGCRMTLGAFKMRGRTGCPRCYMTFHDQLVPLLERVHDATVHRGRCPAATARLAPDPVNLTELRERLRDAIAGERYEEAGRLRDELRQLTGGDIDEPDAPPRGSPGGGPGSAG
ncbi:MAG: UvrB/UvrC motif-containing protein [Planctomycetota bacterium]